MGKRDKQRDSDPVKVKETTKRAKVDWRAFPGPAGAGSATALRVEIDRNAYADITAHAKESLEAEVCGVLVGKSCEDDEGPWVHVQAVIRGTAAREGSTHVTFTQETWNTVHETLEHDHAGKRIVGWYHTHPGFGVEFSEMDLFIQRNFFPGPEQVALVTDPLGGAVAICRNGEAGIEYLDRFWVDGRDQPGVRPESATQASSATSRGAASPSASTGGSAPVDSRALRSLEERVAQLTQALDEVRTFFHRTITFVAMVACASIIGLVGYMIYRAMYSDREPPRLGSYAPAAVRMGDRTVMVGLQVVEWPIPDDMNAALIEAAKEYARLESEARAKAVEKAGAGAPADTSAAGETPPPKPHP